MFSRLVIKRYEKIEFVSLLSPPSSHRHQQGLWLCFSNAISIRKRCFHILFS
nr:MAG TPA: hypothetical protein [Caudoviricetes sp.]